MNISNRKLYLTPSQREIAIALGCLIFGSILRLIWGMDMEWKSEEQWTYEQARKVATGEIPLPRIGILSSIGIPHGGVGMWCFVAIAKFSPTPVAMARYIQGMNVLTLWCFFAFILTQISASERTSWLWGLGIMSVNPLAILFSRKIWIPDLLFPFLLLTLLGHWFRQKNWGSFLWGLCPFLSGQIHLSGFIFTAALFLCTIWHDYQKKTLKKIAWLGWILGTFCASIPFLLWAIEALPQWQGARSSVVGFIFPKFYIQWITTALGVNLSYSLQDTFWSDFLAEPMIFGIPTYLMGLAHLSLTAIGCYSLYKMWHSHIFHWRKFLPNPKDKALIFYLKTTAWGAGGLFTLAAVNFVPYYIPIVFPFPFLWLAYIFKRNQKILSSIICFQLLISITFLSFIHYTGGTENSDYGITYRQQMNK